MSKYDGMTGVKILIVILAIVIAGGFILLLTQAAPSQSEEKALYNDGVCECGGHYKMVSSLLTEREHRHYSFICDKCGMMIDLSYNPNR